MYTSLLRAVGVLMLVALIAVGVEAARTYSTQTSEPIPADDTGEVACTADAKQCPDGSFVGRTGPDCSFAPCPGDSSEQTVCTDEMKQAAFCTMEYAPVCGRVEVQCVTEPCDPVPKTFSNGCTACAEGNVISYTAGACETQVE